MRWGRVGGGRDGPENPQSPLPLLSRPATLHRAGRLRRTTRSVLLADRYAATAPSRSRGPRVRRKRFNTLGEHCIEKFTGRLSRTLILATY